VTDLECLEFSPFVVALPSPPFSRLGAERARRPVNDGIFELLPRQCCATVRYYYLIAAKIYFLTHSLGAMGLLVGNRGKIVSSTAMGLLVGNRGKIVSSTLENSSFCDLASLVCSQFILEHPFQ
jgi:hypothetical protein